MSRSWAIVVSGLALGCGRGGANTSSGVPDGGADNTDGAVAGRWQPHPGTAWQWQITGAVDISVKAAVFDIDLFEAPQATIDQLHARDRRVICYFDTAYEPDRLDSAQLAPYRGSPVGGWPGQYWLDVRVAAVRAVMRGRIALAATKHCDAIEPDDVDVSSNDTQLHITPAEQLDFIRFVIAEGHARDLAVGLKNDLDQVGELVAQVEFAINEECFHNDECDQLTPFITADRPVWQVEYAAGDLATKAAEICPQANARNFDTLIKHLDLGPERYACR